MVARIHTDKHLKQTLEDATLVADISPPFEKETEHYESFMDVGQLVCFQSEL